MAFRKVQTWLVALGLTLGVFQFVPGVHAQTQSQDPNAQQQQQPQETQTKTYVGQIVQARDGRFALLTDKAAGRGFFLDDQEKAKKFNGQNVKVTGKLDAQANLIHVSDIQPA